MKRLRRRTLFSIFVMATVAIAGCGGGGGSSSLPNPTPTPSVSPTPTPTPGTTGRLRVVQASPDAPNVNVLVDDATILNNVAYKGVSNYFETGSGARRFRLVSSANTGSTVLDSNLVVQPNVDQTVLTVGRLANIQVVVRQDNNAGLAAGNVRLSLIHAASGLGNVDIYVTGTDEDINGIPPTAANIGFKSSTSEVDFPAGAYRIRVTAAGTKDPVLLDTGAINLVAGKIYAGVAVGDSGAGQAPGVIVLQNN